MAKSVTKSLVGAISLASCTSHLALAYDPSQRTCTGQNFCLTSFVWCAEMDNLKNEQTGCSFPVGAYPFTPNEKVTTNPAMLLTGNEYNISWKTGPQISSTTEPYTVLVQWIFTNSSSDTTLTPMWETNTTSSWIIIRFDDILRSFLTGLTPDINSFTARGLISNNWQNNIAVSIPSLLIDANGNAPADRSQPFSLQSSVVGFYMKTMEESAHHDEYGKWKLGVSVGVGIGVPLLMAVAAWMGWRTGRKGVPRNIMESK